MRLAIIGLGSIGTRHLKNALALGCEVSVVDSNPEREAAARAMGASIGPFETAPDAMMVCTPYDKHLTWARTAINGRIPLFIEKPLGSLDQIEDWRRLVQASEGLTTQVGWNWRFHRILQAFKDRHRNKRITGLHFVCDTSLADWPGRTYGDPILECSHEIDAALSWDAPAFVPSVRFAKRSENSAFIEFTGGATVSLDWAARPYREVSVDVDGEELEVFPYAGSSDELDLSYRLELKHFLDCVQSGRQTDVPLADGLRVLEVCKAIEEMARATA